MKPTMFRIRAVALLGALRICACSLQDFDALGAGANNTTGGVDQGVGGTSNTGGNATTQGGSAGTGGRNTTGGRNPTGGTSAEAGSTTLLTNPSFEKGSVVGWIVDPASEVGLPNDTAHSVYVQGPIGTATIHEGARQLSIYSATKDFQIKVYQVLSGLVDGQYTFSGWFTRGLMTNAYLYATGCGGAEPPHVDIPLGDVWAQVSVPNIAVVGSQCEVGFYVEGISSEWLNADDFSFQPVPASN